MKVKELIKALADEDMDAQVCIEVDSEYYNHAMPIEGILSISWNKNQAGNVVIAPESKVTPNHELDE